MSGNPVLSWTAVDGAAKYRVQVSSDAAFAALNYNLDTVNLAATPPTHLPIGRLYWRVAAVYAGSGVGPFAVGSFVKSFASAPEPTAPAVGATLVFPDDPPLFTWAPVVGAQTYDLEIDDAADFVGATLATTENTSFTVKDVQSVGTYFWRVRGKSGPLNTDWSEARSFSVVWQDAPQLQSPPNTTATSVEDVVLRWSAVKGAATYQLQVSPNGEWANNIALDVVVKGTQFSPVNAVVSNHLGNGSYYWRVRARDARATPGTGPWSEERQFQRAWTDRPQLVAPTNQEVVAVPALTWTSVDHAAHYQVEISTDVNFSPNTVSSCITNQTTLTPHTLSGGSAKYPQSLPGTCSFDPAPGTTYWWRVRALDTPGTAANTPSVLGVYSLARSFTYAPDAVTVTGPPSGSESSAPVLTWEPVDGFAQYQVTVRKANGQNAKVVKTHGLSYSPDVLTGFKATDGPFTWFVQTVDAAGRLGIAPTASVHRSFSLVAPASPGPVPDVVAADQGRPWALPSFTWAPVEGATSYRVYYANAATGIYQTLGTNIPYAAYTPLTALAPGEYVWYVEAYKDATFLSGSSGPGSFSIATLDPVEHLSPATCSTSQCPPLGQTPTFSWAFSEASAFYLLYLATDPNFTNVVRTYKTQYNHFTPRESLLDSTAGQAYYWFVRPCQTSTVCGAFESALDRAASFRKQSAGVEQLQPENGAQVPNLPAFSWKDYWATAPAGAGAKGYRIQVSAVEDFSTLVDDVIVDQAVYAPHGKTYPEGPLFWRVQAIDGSSNPLTFSATRQFTKASGWPATVLPVQEAVVPGAPFFQWAAQPYAAKYEVEVYKNGDGNFSSANKTDGATTSQTAWSPLDALDGQGRYAWRVRRLDVDGRPGSWTPARFFTLAAAAPALRAPSPSAVTVGSRLLFRWDAVSHAASYRLQTSAAPTFATTVDNQATVMTAWAPTKAYGEASYYWRVQVLDPNGNVVATSPSQEQQATASFVVCGTGAPDTDGDGFRDACDDVDDVRNDIATYRFVRALIDAGVTAGCSAGPNTLLYCPTAGVTREQMAIFLLRAREGAAYVPPPAKGAFSDVPVTSPFAAWIEELKARGITTGCGPTTYCPQSTVTRGDMALFLLRAVPGGHAEQDHLDVYSGRFVDVPESAYYARFVEHLAQHQVTSGCGTDVYCPSDPVTREQMAVFLTRAFNLPVRPS